MKKTPLYTRSLAAVALLASIGTTLHAQQAGPPAYGPPITLEQAKRAMAAAEAEARKNNWPVVITIVDSGGNDVMMQRLDNTQIGSLAIARGKATTANNLRRSTKLLEDALAAGGAGLRIVTFPGVVATEGGLPIIVDGRIVGAIGVSGVTSQQDGMVAKAGLDAIAGGSK